MRLFSTELMLLLLLQLLLMVMLVLKRIVAGLTIWNADRQTRRFGMPTVKFNEFMCTSCASVNVQVDSSVAYSSVSLQRLPVHRLRLVLVASSPVAASKVQVV